MDLTQLKTLIHVAELGSLSKAADRLYIAQPALSRQIRLLEQELGVYLFERHGRGMVITDEGREVLDRATRIMAEIEGIRSSVAKGECSYKGRISIGTTPTVAEIVTIPLMKRVRDAHPQLGVRFCSAFTGYLLDWLQRGELDLAVSYNPQPVRSLRTIPIMMENLLLVGGEKDGLSLDTPVSFKELGGMDLILPSPRHGLRTIIEEYALQSKITLRTQLEADSFGTMIDLVRNGFGSTILPLAPIYLLVKSGRLCAAPLIDPAPTRKVVLVFPADRAVNPAARFVGEVFKEIAGDLVSKTIWAGHLLAPAQE